MAALKDDKLKPDLSLIPRVALVRAAEAFQVGVKKYSRYNYCGGMEASRLIAALLRHATDWFEGEENDKEDGQSTLGAVIACAAMILRQQELGTLKDDRYRPQAKPNKLGHVWQVESVSLINGHKRILATFTTDNEATAYAEKWQVSMAPFATLSVKVVKVD